MNQSDVLIGTKPFMHTDATGASSDTIFARLGCDADNSNFCLPQAAVPSTRSGLLHQPHDWNYSARLSPFTSEKARHSTVEGPMRLVSASSSFVQEQHLLPPPLLTSFQATFPRLRGKTKHTRALRCCADSYPNVESRPQISTHSVFLSLVCPRLPLSALHTFDSTDLHD